MDDAAEDGEHEADAADEQVEAADQVAAGAAERRAGRDDQALRAAERRHHVIYGASVHAVSSTHSGSDGRCGVARCGRRWRAQLEAH